jgi:hypothetical protein
MYDVYHPLIGNGQKILSMVTPYQHETLFLSHQTKHSSLTLQWYIPDEMRCPQYQTTMASRNIRIHIRDQLVTNNQYIEALTTNWIYTNQSLFPPHILGLGK